ncbi:MAG: hypothetical protein ACYSR0_06005 [Planctomycetota bacterium]|jgi:aryl-alcohol dehydrogenase-like predicted oxidoreductase
MRKVKLGKTGIEVSRLGIGTGTGLPLVDSFIIGMLNKKEIDENCKIVNTASRELEGVEKQIT